MDKILVKGTQEFMDKEIPVVEGGFGEGQKVMFAKTIAEIHGVELKRINELINNNIDEFEFDIDILDLSMDVENVHSIKDLLLSAGYTNRGITATLNQNGNFYLLSEQGYHALVSIMKTEKAKAIRKQLRREYFAMREIINSNEQLKAQLLLEIYNGGQSGVLASKQLTELEKKPLLDKIEKQKPKVNWFDDFLNSEGTYNSTQVAKLFKLSSAQKLNKILNEKKIIYKKGTNWLPYSDVDKSWYKLIVGSNNEHNYSQLKFSPKGVYEISKLLEIEFKEEDLENLA